MCPKTFFYDSGHASMCVARARAGSSARANLAHGARRVSRARTRVIRASDARQGARDAREDVRIVIVPGFLSGAGDYEDLARALIERGYASTTVVPFRASDWWPTLAGGAFDTLLEKLDETARRAADERERVVVLVAHSAGGWLSRLWMGSKVSYCGRAPYGGAKYVRALITLGSPHSSAEAYPFGRVLETRPGEDECAMSDAARGSSLALTNEVYPGAYESGVKYVAVAGALNFVGAKTFDVGSVLRANKPVAQAWREYVAGISYKANTGNDAKVIGDGVCPVDVAALEGAVNIRVTCHHSPNSTCDWYGSPSIIDEWITHIS